MSKLLSSVTMSLDGFIAGPGGDMSRMTSYLGPNPTVDELIDNIRGAPRRQAHLRRRRSVQRRRDPGRQAVRRRLERTAVRAHPPRPGHAGAGRHRRRSRAGAPGAPQRTNASSWPVVRIASHQCHVSGQARTSDAGRRHARFPARRGAWPRIAVMVDEAIREVGLTTNRSTAEVPTPNCGESGMPNCSRRPPGRLQGRSLAAGGDREVIPGRVAMSWIGAERLRRRGALRWRLRPRR
jgi:hypothetical protein